MDNPTCTQLKYQKTLVDSFGASASAALCSIAYMYSHMHAHTYTQTLCLNNMLVKSSANLEYFGIEDDSRNTVNYLSTVESKALNRVCVYEHHHTHIHCFSFTDYKDIYIHCS